MSHSEETRRKIGAALRGKAKSPEHRAKLAMALQGRKQPVELVTQRATSNRGRVRSDQARVKMSMADQKSWTDDRRSHYSQLYTGKKFGGEDAAGFYIMDGYVYLTGQWGHPLCRDNGVVAEHRKVLYDKIGPGPHLCHWGCGKALEWGGRLGLQADHLDGDVANNDLGNLVQSCDGCNKSRASAGNPVDWEAKCQS